MPPPPQYSLWQLILYFLKLGTWGFGGPVALVGYMHLFVFGTLVALSLCVTNRESQKFAKLHVSTDTVLDAAWRP